jgi:hypothetical protein
MGLAFAVAFRHSSCFQRHSILMLNLSVILFRNSHFNISEQSSINRLNLSMISFHHSNEKTIHKLFHHDNPISEGYAPVIMRVTLAFQNI